MNKTITDYEDVKCYMQFHDLREAILAVERFTEMYKVRALTCVYMFFLLLLLSLGIHYLELSQAATKSNFSLTHHNF